MTMIDFFAAVSNGFRAWGASSLILALPVVGEFLNIAFRGATTSAKFEWKLADCPSRLNSIRVFAVSLWHEGSTSPFKVNMWVIVLLFAFLVTAGTGIFAASNFSSDGLSDYRLTILMGFAWGFISSAGWAFTISTGENPRAMAKSSAVLLFTFQGIAFGLGMA